MIIRTGKEVRFLDEMDRQRYLAHDPEFSRIIRYWLFDAMPDSRTRPNHRVLDGGIAPMDWPGWFTCAPPLGEGCRCTLVGITGRRREALLGTGHYFDLTAGIPEGAGLDPGYVRPAHSIYNDPVR